MPPQFATVDDLKARLAGTGGTFQKAGQDQVLQDLLDEVGTDLEQYTGRSFTPNPSLDESGEDTAPDATVIVNIAGRRVVPIPDARVLSSVTLYTRSLLSTETRRDYEPIIRNGVITDLVLFPDQPSRIPFQLYGHILTLTGRFGIWPAPLDVRGAVLLMAARAYKEQDARFGSVVALPDGGSVAYFGQLPPRAKMTLDHYALEVGP